MRKPRDLSPEQGLLRSRGSAIGRPHSLRLALEPRLVFDGAATATAHAAGRDHADGADADGSDAARTDAHDTPPAPDTPAAPGSPAASGSAPSIALIDTRIAGYAAIAASLPADTHIVYVDGSRDGLAALDAAIRDAGAPVAGISIYAHGSDGSITLGNRTLDGAALAGEAGSLLAGWRAALTSDADLLVYGCSVAGSTTGVGFVQALADLTGADVAASDDATGSAAAGGDWTLEVTTGAIEHAAIAVDGFDGLLLPSSISDTTPGTRTTAEDTPLTVTGLTLADGDDPALMTLRVQTSGGTSTFTLTGLSVTAGSNGTGDFTLSGSRASLAAALASFTFTPDADRNGQTGGYAPHIDFTATDVTNADAPASFTLSGLDVTAVNDAPTVTPVAISVAEGASGTFTAGNFNLVDVDNDPQQVIYKITSLPAHGTLSLAGNPLVIGSTFDSTQAASLVYTHDGSQVRAGLYPGSEADGFTIRVDDGAQGVIASVTMPVVLTPVNQGPSVTAGATVYEGQQSVPVTLTISDPDQASGVAHTIRIDSLPLRGTLYYDGVAVSAGQSIADPTKLTYSHDGNDLNGGFPPNETFLVTVTDDGGGQGAGHELSVQQTVTLTLRPVNDDPLLLTNDPLTVGGANNPIGNTLLKVTDPDSFAQNLTFTLTDTSGLAHGELQLNGVQLAAGASFTQLDIDSGALRYVWTSGTIADTFTDTFAFTVKDGAITLLPNAYTQTREGGIYPDATDPNAALSVFTFTIHKPPLSTGSPGSGSGSSGGPNQPPVVGNVDGIGYARLSEGGSVTITNADLSFSDSDNATDQIVYRLLDLPSGGTLQLAGTALGLYGTFTQADIDAGRLTFVHDGGEVFTTDFDFNVTDGTNLVDNGGLHFNFAIQAKPVDDAPTGNAPDGFLMEDGWLVFNSNTPGPQLTASARTNLTLGDVDGSGDQVYVGGAQNPTNDPAWDATGYSQADTASQRYLRIDTLPVHGALQRLVGGVWTTITAGELATLKITQADLDAGTLRYRHDGTDGPGDLADSFKYTPYDRFDTAGAQQTVTLAMAPLNDPPVASVNNELTVVEGGSGTIGGQSGGGSGGAQLVFTDSDNNAIQRQYRISDAPDHGTLLLDGVALGVGSVFTQADLDAGRVRYRHDGSETAGTHLDHFDFTVSDGGGDNPVTGATNNVPGIYYINVAPANDLPTITAAQTTLDVTASGTTPVSVPGVTVADIDLGFIAVGETDFLRVEVQVLDAADAAVAGAQLDFTAAAPASALAFVNGLGTNTLTVQGTKAEIDAVLASLRVAYTVDRNVATDKLHISVDDRLYDAAGTLSGGANGGAVNQDGSTIDAVHNRASVDITLTASSDNDPPTLTNPTAYSVNEDAPLTLSGFVITDVDSFAKPVTVTVALYADSGHTTLADAATQGALGIVTSTGLTTAAGSGTNTVTLGGTLADVLAALNALRFQGAADFNDGPLYLRTTFTDWGHADVPAGNSLSVDNTITIVPVNDAPVLTVPGTQTLGAGSSVAISGISFQDTKDTAQGASDAFYTVTVLAPNAGDTLAATVSGTATSSYDAGTQTLTVSGTRADVNATLANLVYTPQDSNADTTYMLTVTVDDRSAGVGNGVEGSGVDGHNTATATIAVHVSSTNEPPVLVVPATASFIEDRGFTALAGVSYADSDDFGATARITLTVTHGLIDLGTRTGLSLVAGAYGSATVTVEGSKSDLNAALATLSYRATSNYHGSDTLSVSVSDLGSTGSGGARTDTQTVALTVAPDNDQPVATSNVTLTPLSEDTTAPAGSRIDTLAFGYSDATDDQTGNGGGNTATPFTYVAIVGNASVAAQGVWQISTTASPDPTHAADWITIPTSGLSPTAALIFTSDRQVRFVPAAEFFGTPGLLSVRLADASSDLGTFLSADATQTRVLASAGGISGIGAWNAVTRTIGIQITAVNDRPTLAPATLSVAEDATLPASQTVSALFGSGYADATDNQSAIPGSGSSAAAFAGLAIVGNAADAATQGVWQYNAGSGWVTIGSGGSAPSDTNAIVLATTAQLRFLPNVANYNGTPGSLTVRGADSVQSTATGVDLSAALALGQVSTWSATTTLTATVTPVNDAPTMPQTAIPPFVVATENATTASGQSIDPVQLMTAGSVGDIDLTTTAGLAGNTFGAGSLSVTISDGIAGDEIVFASGYSLPAGVTFTGGTGNTPLLVSFDADTTLAEVDGLIAAIRYRSTSDNPTQSGTDNTRLYIVVLNDGNNAQTGGNAGGPAALNSLIRIGQIAITAVNDPPTAVDDSNAITENTASISGSVRPGTPGQDSDPDNTNAELTVTAIRTGTEAGSGTTGTIGLALAGQYGTLTLNADGSYTYALDNSNPTVNALKTGQSLSDVFTYRIADPGSLSDTAQLTITINGLTDGPPTITPSDGNGAETGQATVFEAGLTTVGDTTETTTGTIAITATDGLSTVTIGGTTLTLTDLANLGTTPVTVDTGEGLLTLTGFTASTTVGGIPTAGTLAYSYTLKARLDHTGAVDSTDPIALAVLDAGGATSTGTLTVRIVDDTPTANADTNAVTEDTALTTSGNVFGSTGASTGDVADRLGADTTATPVTAIAFGATTGTVGSALAGNYGALTLNADGSYSYALDNTNAAVNALKTGDTLTETFTYTLTDADGDSSSTTLTITVQGTTDGPPSVIPNDGNGAETGQATVFEAGLTSVGDTSETTTGTIAITASDGLTSVSVGGTTLTLAQLNALGTTPITVDTGEGLLTLTGFTASTTVGGIPTAGTLAYSYTLKARLDHTGAVDSTDPVALSVLDAGGATNTGTLTVRIVDDVPTANADTNSVAEDSGTPATGNVFGATGASAGDVADRIGADTTATPVTAVSFGATTGTVGSALSGNYGALTLNADGTYSYALDNANAAVNALKTGDTLTETFTYTLTDADGDTSSTTLTITINGTTDGPPTVTPNDGNGAETGQATVREAGLTSVGDTSETTTGTIAITATDGLSTVTVGGTTLTLAQLSALGTTPVTVDTGEGLLTLTGFTASTTVGGIPTAGTLAYSYTLKARLDHTGATDSTDPIALAVLDAGGATSTGTLTVRIVDDTPTANADLNAVTEDSGTPATGNVFGATGASAGDVADRIGADTTATPVAAVSFGATTGTVGSALSGNYGALTLNADGSYSYALDNSSAAVNALKTGDTLTESFTYTLTDADGDTSSTTLTITINGTTDGPPTITPDDGNGAETGQSTVFEAGLTSAGDTSETTTGTIAITATDGLSTVTVGGTTLSLTDLANLGTTPVTVDTGEGLLTLTGFTTTSSVGGIPTAGTLAYSYTLKARLDHTGAIDSTDPVALSVLDAGGATSTGTLTVRIVDDTPTANADSNAVTEDTALTTSGNVFGSTGASTGDVADRLGADSTATPVTAVSFGATTGTVGSALSGNYGALTLNADGSYSYALDNSSAAVNALKTGDTLTESFTYTLTDADGDTSSTTLTITINGTTDGPPTITPDDGNGAETGQATVFEAGLTSVGDTTETTTGTIAITASDGLTSVTVGGTTLTLAQLNALGTTPITVDTGEGLLTLTGFTASTTVGGIPTAGTLAYSYTLKARLDHTGAVDSTDPIALAVLDAGGATSTGTLTVRIVDDVPTANADTNSVAEDSGTPATGNVFGATGASIGDVTDRLGADTTATPVTAIAFGATTGTVGSTLSGNYGALTLNADGSYSYALDNTNAAVNALKTGDTLTETFTYTLTDADGDGDSTTLTITINGLTDGPPTITPDDGNGAETGQATVFEAGLASVGDTSETTTGTIAISATDGLTSVTVGGTTLSLAQLAALGTTPVTVDTGEGLLTLTGFTASTTVGGIPTAGTLAYSYTLKARLDHTGAVDSTDPIALAVLDAGGATSTGTLTVRIVDDTPTANADTNAVTEDTALTTSGNVFGSTGASTGDVADRLGADTTATPITAIAFGATTGTVGSALAGNYGALTLNADGTYSYALDNTNPTVNALKTGDTLTETFTYTLTDADGDSSSTTLTITVQGTTDGPPSVIPNDGNGAETGQATVFEAGLTSAGDTTETTTGSIAISATDGLTSVTVGGTTLTLAQLSALGTTPITVDTGEGLLTLTGFTASTTVGGIPTAGTLAYSYTLKARLDHTGAVDSTDPIELAVLDAGGATSTGTLTVRIVDDTPTANADTNAVTEDTALTTSGNVFGSTGASTGDVADRLGADTTATPVTAIAFGATTGTVGSALAGNYGALTLNADGTYSYALDNANAAVNALKTGDTLTETFTYTLTDADGDTSSTTLTITINGTTDGPPTITPNDGNGAETGQATVLEAGLTSVGDTSETTTGTIAITASDGLTSVSVGGTTLTLAQLNALGTTPITVDTGEGLLTLTGFTASTTVGGIPTAGTLAYSYTLKARLDHTGAVDSTDPVALSVLDAGGATNTGTLTVRIVDDVPTANADSNAVTEGTTTAGTSTTGNVFGSSGASTGDVADRLGADTTATPVTAIAFGPTTGMVGSALAGNYGALTLNADGTYSYVLDNANPTVNALKTGDTLTETFTYTLTDADGDTSSTTLTITVHGTNDPPVAVDESTTTPEDTPVGGNLLVNDSDVDTPHADLRVQSFTIAGDPTVYAPGATATMPGIGTLTVSPTGDWLFTPATDYSGPVPVVTYTLTDGALTDTATLTLDVTPVTDLPTLVLPPVSVDEDGVVPVSILPAIGDTLPADLGIEHLNSVTISGIPDGGHFTNAAGDVLVPVGGVLTLTPAQLAGLSFAPPRDFSGTVVFGVTAVAQDGSAPPASTSGPLTVTVRPVTDTPVLDIVSAFQTPDRIAHLDLSSRVTDTVLTDAGAEHLVRVTISGLPDGTTLRLADGSTVPVNGGIATLAPNQLAGITLLPPGGFTGALVLTLTSVAVDGNATEATASRQLTLHYGSGGGSVPPVSPLQPPLNPAPGEQPTGLPTEPKPPAEDPFPFLFRYGSLTEFARAGDGHNQELYLYGQARDQLMVELRPESFTQPKDLFRHTNPNEHLSFEAVQPDGRPLPPWLKFDAENLRFSGTPPEGFGGLDVVIIAYDSQGRHAAALFRIRPSREVGTAPVAPPAVAPPPAIEPPPAPAAPTSGDAPPPQAGLSMPAGDWLAALGLLADDAPPAADAHAAHDGFSARLQQALPPTLATSSRALADTLLATD